MKLKIKMLIAFTTFIFSLVSAQQQFIGYRTGNYTGVNGVFFNPAHIADSRYKWDINLMGVNSGAGNSNSNFKINNIFDAVSHIDSLMFSGIAANRLSAFTDVDILGPSFLYNASKNNAFAITTRVRVLANMNDLDGKMINGIRNITSDNTFPYTISYKNNQGIRVNGWSEIGFSWGHVLMNKGANFIKGGITAKFLRGTGNTYLNINRLQGILSKATNNSVYLTNASGTITTSNNFDYRNSNVSDILKARGYGFGGDVGLVYEYRPENMLHLKENNEYKLRVGVSVMDIGSIQYKNIDKGYGNYSIDISGKNENFNLNKLEGKSVQDIRKVIDDSTNYFAKNSSSALSNVSLPANVQLDIDYNFQKGFYVNIAGQYSLIWAEEKQNSYYQNNVTITPRYETKFFGIYAPVNYNPVTNINAGLSLRGGPFFIGSGSILSLAFGKSGQLDFHVGLRIGGFNKRKGARVIDTFTNKTILPGNDSDGDGIIDAKDKCPNVVGLAKYEGCPVPDTDGDGINDELDKCPNVAGLAKYEGCPVPDSDGDGINDDNDKCPKLAGVAAYNGCPIINNELIKIVQYAARNILFETKKDILLAGSKTKLNDVVKVLQENPILKLIIEGHTDNVGSEENNQMLSEKRAIAVKAYLTSKGISENRLQPVGYGESKPLYDNDSQEGRNLNRRVELKLSY